MKANEQAAHLATLREGDLRSFRWVYDREHGKVYGFCLKLLGAPAAAEEVTSDVFVRLWQKRAIIDPALPIAPLLFKITRDLAWNYLKREARVNRQQEDYRALQETSALAPIEEDLIFADYLRIAETAIAQLPTRQREIFTLRYKSGKSNQQIASQLDLSESTVRVQLARAKQFLRQFLRSHPELPLLLLQVIWIVH